MASIPGPAACACLGVLLVVGACALSTVPVLPCCLGLPDSALHRRSRAFGERFPITTSSGSALVYIPYFVALQPKIYRLAYFFYGWKTERKTERKPRSKNTWENRRCKETSLFCGGLKAAAEEANKDRQAISVRSATRQVAALRTRCYSNSSTARCSFSTMGMCCGQASSHW